ncbi:MAG: site-specific integrase [Polyangiaceae bacterium]|nr:site-specific integrase [Polyangiaceae bacterium]
MRGTRTALAILLEMAAKARAGRPWDAVVAAVETLCAGAVTSAQEAPTLPTFLQHLEDWTSGELAKKYPHHIKVKKSADGDETRIRKHIAPVLESVLVDEVTLDHCELVMAGIPAERSDGTRRQVAQVLRRGLALAVYPCRYRKDQPIPQGWLPKVKSNKAKECLYPDEDRALLACAPTDSHPGVPLLRRLAYGLLAREGMRADELARIEWRDVDLERGRIDLDVNKTSDPRAWALGDGSLAALRIWKENFCKGATPKDRVLQQDGVPLDMSRLAEQLRDDLHAAGVNREKLFERSATRLPIRAHDLRATFVTVALATGKTEAWVADRTGHRSSQMINRYRRRARTWTEQKTRRADRASQGAAGPLCPMYRPIFSGPTGT